MHGFALDVPPSRISVFTFVIPLFDKIEGLHLGLSSEIARFGPLASTSVDDLCLRIQDTLANQPVMQDDFDDLETFKLYLRSADQSGIYPRWCSVLVDCLEERPENAVEKVKLLMSETNGGLTFPTSALKELHAVLQTRPEQALAFVAQWREDNLKTFFGKGDSQ